MLRLLRDLGAGADIVSAGEMARALAAGFAAERIVFSGVGKAGDELRAAVAGRRRAPQRRVGGGAGSAGGRSPDERAAPSRVGIRVNPDITADTHPYISTGKSGIKFGVPVDQVPARRR